jgi:hypothetical protein
LDHHLKQLELDQINLDDYKLGAAYCKKSLLKGGISVFVHEKYNYLNVELKLIIFGDINIDYLTDNERRKQLDAMLVSYNLAATVHFPTRVQNQSCRAIDNIFIDKYKFTKYTASSISYNGLSDHDAQLLTIKDINV